MACENLAIGIDLGTTYCCVAGIVDGELTAIENVFGSRTMPSCVAFTDEGRLIGNPALQQMKLNPEMTIFDVKRLIGRKSDDSVVQKEIDRLPFEIVRDIKEGVNRIKYKMKDRGEEKYFTCEEISAILLKEMVRTAQNKIGTIPTDAVITIPAYYGHNERKATEDAGKIAGLNVLRVINEPTAAAIGYYGLEQITSDEKILVYDLGGGTFDVSILDHCNSEDIDLTVVGTGGDPHLGGRDFDEAIGNYIRDRIRERFGAIDLTRQTENEIFIQSEIAKKELSVQSNVRIKLDDVGWERFTTIISRVKFDSLIKEYLDRTFEIVQNTLNEAGLKETDIDKVILVGGSTRIPKLREKMVEMFPYATVPDANRANPDEVVALGAGMLAVSLIEEASYRRAREIDLVDLTALSLGVEVIGQRMSILLKRSSPIPNEVEDTYYTVSDNQTRVKFSVYEGERECVQDNNNIGSFTLTGIPPKKKREEPLLVKLTIDKNGMVDIVATVKSTGKKEGLIINATSASNITSEERQEMIAEAARYEKQDRAWLSKVDSRYKLVDLIYKVQDRLKSRQNQPLQNICDQIDQSLEEEKKFRDKAVYNKQYEELNELFQREFPN